jgi:hypothetical protein
VKRQSAPAGLQDPLAGLTEALGSRPPKALAVLPREALEDLELAVREARARQAAELEASVESSLRLAPRPLKPLLRKVLTG